ncbi:MAG: Gfo/Idh/MocA family oxidoreductase [Erysipelotrichaceae bacterium]|nr:Gfo/Idh/MocA family oxidoreductase [Erysipelotrichaceae bacterium]
MLNVGILGTGMISEGFMEAVKFVPSMKVSAILSRDLEKGKAFAFKYTIEKTYNEIDLLLKDKDIDIIYIGLPNSLHYEMALKALQAKKHVIVEKPFTSNMKEFISLIEASVTHKAQIFEMNRVLHLPNFHVLKEHIKDIAPIRLVTINFCKYSRKYDDYLAGKDPNVFSDEFSGGALVDLGVYGVHLVSALFGAPQEINYVASKLPNTIDSSGILTMSYEGMICTCIQSKNSKSDPKIVIQGEKGSLIVNSVSGLLENVELDQATKTNIGLKQESDGMAYTLKEIARIIEEKDEKAYLLELDHIQTVMSILDEARASAGIVFKADLKKKKHWFSKKEKAPKVKKEARPKKEPKVKKAPKPKKEKKTKDKKVNKSQS